MNRIIRNTAVFACALMIFSCAKKKDEDYNAMEAAALKAWVEINAPQAEPLEGDGSIYVEWFRGPETGNKVKSGNWVMLDYNGTSLQNNIFVTRYAQTAMIEGTYTNRTHYVPQYLEITEPARVISCLQQTILQMKEGDSARIYSPSSQAFGSYGSTYSGGYQGQYALSASVPCIFSIKVEEIVQYPEEREKSLVADYANRNWGLAADEYFKDGFFVIRENMDEDADGITADSTINLWYVGIVLDGFIFDTNVDSVALEQWGYNTSYKPLSYKPDKDSESKSYKDAFYEVMTTMKYGSSGTMVFISKYGYEQYGSTSGSTVIQPYTPLVFEFSIDTNIK